MRPTDRKCLIARAQCFHRLGEADKALADANETLRDDNKYIKVSSIGTCALYIKTSAISHISHKLLLE